MACPFFMPVEKLDGGWLHPTRLPLGAGWSGNCCASDEQTFTPSEPELREHCNLGYAATCSHLPRQRSADAVRFSIARDRGARLEVRFVCEAAHLPAEHGTLNFDMSLDRWTSAHVNPRIQKMADCYLQSYLLRRTQSVGLKS